MKKFILSIALTVTTTNDAQATMNLNISPTLLLAKMLYLEYALR